MVEGQGGTEFATCGWLLKFAGNFDSSSGGSIGGSISLRDWYSGLELDGLGKRSEPCSSFHNAITGRDATKTFGS